MAEATKEGTLTPTGVDLAGVGPATRDLQRSVHGDIVLLVVATLALIFLIVALMLRSPVAAVAVVGTVIVSYASALGVSVVVWQRLFGHPLHWAVAPMAFIALVAVGADYNLLLAMRIREEIRAFAGTEGAVTTAGIVFGITMFALVGSTVLSVARVGFTVGALAGYPDRPDLPDAIDGGVAGPLVLVAVPDQPRDTPSAVARVDVTWAYGVNVLDLEPHGPLPPEIYWRRRGLALGIAVVVIGIVVAAVVAVLSGNAGANTTADKPKASQNPPAAAPTQTEVKTPVVPPAGQNQAPVETPTAAVQPPPVLKEGDDCPDSTLAVKGLTNAPQYVIGDQPKFVMVVTNIGLVACKRDVGAAVLAAYVYSLDNKRLWSNLDCAPSNETLVKTFAPGEQVVTSVTWTGMGSARQCPLPRQPIGPGTYNLVVQLGNLRSAPVPFILAPAAAPGAPPPGGAPQPGMPAQAPLGPPPGPPPSGN